MASVRTYGLICRTPLRFILFLTFVLALSRLLTTVFFPPEPLCLKLNVCPLDSNSLNASNCRQISCNSIGCWDQSDVEVNLLNNKHLIFDPFPQTRHDVQPDEDGLPDCPRQPFVLIGAIQVVTQRRSESEIAAANPNLELGGRFRPIGCVARQKVAVILPYRNRREHLEIFLNNIHPVLQRQQLDYGIFVVEQSANGHFNRGLLLNIGYSEAKKLGNYSCFIFHDVDLLPLNDRHIYSCNHQPRHLSVAIDKFGYTLPYNDIFGGITAMTDVQFRTINGYSNSYWGWGGEDDDVSLRIRSNEYCIARYPGTLARYTMIKHGSDLTNPVNPARTHLLKNAARRLKIDGLSSLKYSVIDTESRALYTWILVDVKMIKIED